MLTIIFGAGASFDSSPDFVVNNNNDNRLPLAKDLFSRRFSGIAKEFPIAFSLINRLRRSANIEHELEKIAEENGSNIPEQLIKIRRYINKVITTAQTNWEHITDRNTTYYEFIDILQKWQEESKKPVTLITFNYDTLLDTACTTHLNLRFNDMNSYILNDTPYKLFKPHGSINWTHFAQMPSGLPVNGINIDRHAGQLQWTQYFSITSEADVLKPGYYKFPAISVPTETKAMFEFPNNHKTEMKKAIHDTTTLLVIGWKAMEKHFLELWGTPEESKQLKKIQIVNSDQLRVNAITHNLSTNGKIYSPSINTYSGGFSKYVTDEFLKFLYDPIHRPEEM